MLLEQSSPAGATLKLAEICKSDTQAELENTEPKREREGRTNDDRGKEAQPLALFRSSGKGGRDVSDQCR